jgi:hypothetical protein
MRGDVDVRWTATRKTLHRTSPTPSQNDNVDPPNRRPRGGYLLAFGALIDVRAARHVRARGHCGVERSSRAVSRVVGYASIGGQQADQQALIRDAHSRRAGPPRSSRRRPEPDGSRGPKGPMGPSNSFYAADSTAQQLPPTLSSIQSISLGAGTYVLNADVSLEDVSPSDSCDLVVCELTYGAASDQVEVGLLGPPVLPRTKGHFR